MFRYCILSLFTAVFSFQFLHAQTTVYPLINAGYVYQNQSFGEIGGKLLFVNNDDHLFRLGASALMGSANGKFGVLPKVQADYLFNTQKNTDIYHGYYFLTGAEFTPQYIAPKAGISIMGLLDVTAGYGFSIHKKGFQGKALSGFNFNVGLNLPTMMLNDLFD